MCKAIFLFILSLNIPHPLISSQVLIDTQTEIISNTPLPKKSYNKEQLEKFAAVIKDGKTVAIVSDLHDVILDRLNIWGDFSRAKKLSFSELTKFIYNVINFGARYISYKLHGSPVQPAIEEYALRDISNNTHLDHILQLITPFKLNEEMYDIYKKRLNIPLFACSNSGEESYNWINKKFNGKLDELFLDKQIATQQNGYLQKDNEKAFEALLQKINSAQIKPRAILMIDDLFKNIEKCTEVLNKHGIEVYGYIFKNASDFEKDLQKQRLIS